jgi:hypothetical protein
MKTDIVVSASSYAATARSTEWTRTFDPERFNVLVYTKNDSHPDHNLIPFVGAEASFKFMTEKTVFFTRRRVFLVL